MFVAAGVETRQPLRQGQLRHAARTPRTRCSPTAQARTERPPRAAQTWHDPREDGELPDVYIAMGQTAENVAELEGVTREEHGRVRRPRRRTSPRRRSRTASASARSRRSRCPTAPWSAKDDGPRAGTTLERRRRAQAGVPPRRHGHRRQLLPAQRRRRRGGRDERHARPRELGHHAAGPDRRRPASPRCRPEIMGLGPIEASRQALAPGRHDDRRHRPGRDQRGVRRAGHPVGPAPRHRPGTSSTSTAARSRSATRSA